MSKDGAHVSSGRRDNFGTALKQCADAGSPVAVLVSLDQDVWPDVENYSPLTTLVFRTQPGGSDNPPEMYSGDPVAVAADWYAQCKPKWLLNHAHYYAPCNERNPVLLAASKMTTAADTKVDRIALMHAAIAASLKSDQNIWLDEFDLAMMILAEQDGFHLALHGDSVGTPDYPAWQHYEKSLSHAAANGHVLLLHEYGLETTLQLAGSDLALRYRKVHDLIEPFAPGLRIIIGECSGGAGYSGQGQAWLDDCAWYDSEAMKDEYLIGFARYQLGGAENWYTLISRWADYVASHPTPIDPPASDREFVSWTNATGQIVSTDNPYNFNIYGDVDLKANTRPKIMRHTCRLSDDGYGAVLGAGEYDDGAAVKAEWKP